MGAPMLVRCFELAGASHDTATRLMQAMNSGLQPGNPHRKLQQDLGLHSPVKQRTEANGAPAKDIAVFPELYRPQLNRFFIVAPVDASGKSFSPPGARQITKASELSTLYAQFRKGMDKICVNDRAEVANTVQLEIPEVKA